MMLKLIGKSIKTAIRIKFKPFASSLGLFLLLSCLTRHQEPSIYGSWEFVKWSDTTRLVFSSDTLTQHYSRLDTIYTIQCTYKISKDSLQLTFFDSTKELHYLKWLSKDKFILNPQKPNMQSIPAIDLIAFRKVN
jgi:hypothetical protein